MSLISNSYIDSAIRELQYFYSLAEIPARVAFHFSQSHDTRELDIFRQAVFFRASSKTPAGLALKRAVNETPPHAWEWYVRKNCSNVQSGAYGQGPDRNERFGNACHAAVLQQVQNLRAGKKITLSELYDIYAKVRHQLAVESNTPDAEDFGKKRLIGGSNYSPLTRGFAPYVAKSQQYYLEAIKGLAPIERDHILKRTVQILSHPEQYRVYELCENASEPPTYVIVHQNPGEEPTLTYVLTMFETDNEGIDMLTGISYSPAGWRINGRCFGSLAFKDSDPFIQHCSLRKIGPYFERGERLFQFLIEPSDLKKVTLDQIAELEAILDNVMRTTRGNATISVMISITLLLRHGFLVTPCQDGIYSDLEALIFPRDFIMKFPFYRKVNLSFTVSPFMRKVVKILGSLEAYDKL
ncbi:MAG TPA: hypothetical protein VMR37_06560, partial [Rhabdochlamydiaceae bacterium]|nr:hypothetical protein [Rhabdochlamydiaceae bacterium]